MKIIHPTTRGGGSHVWTWLITLAITHIPPVYSVTTNSEARLLKTLFTGHDKEARPVEDPAYPTVVTLAFLPMSLREMKEQEQFVNIYGVFVAVYVDEYLTWNPADYSGIKRVTIDPNKVWRPSIGILNSVNKFFDMDTMSGMKSLLHADGSIWWMMGGEYKFTCVINTLNFPFDGHTCRLEIMSWTEGQSFIRLTYESPNITMDLYTVPHGLWSITSATVSAVNMTTALSPDIFDIIRFTFVLKRKNSYQIFKLILPLVLTMLLLPTMFLIPSDAGEKISVGITVLLTLFVYQLALSEATPATSDYVPILTTFLTFLMVLTACSVFVSSLTLRLHYTTSRQPPPRWLQRLVLRHLARCLCMADTYRDPETPAVPQETKTSESVESLSKPAVECEAWASRLVTNMEVIVEKIRSEEQAAFILDQWKKLGHVLDIFFFWVFVLAVTITTIAIFSNGAAGQ